MVLDGDAAVPCMQAVDSENNHRRLSAITVALGTKLLEMNVSDSGQQTPTETNLKDGAPRQVSQGHPWGSAEASCHSDLRCQAEATSTSLFALCERLTSPM